MKSRSLVALLLLASCLSSGAPTKPNEREWNQLLASHEWLETLRRSSLDPKSVPTRKEQIEILLDMHQKIKPAYDAFLEKLSEYYERTGDKRAARLYANEKIRLGDEYMNILARYERAIGLYQSALTIDPSNQEAKRRIEVAESKRFVTEQTFGAVRPGMKEADVKKLVGMPREDWIKQVIQKNRAYSVWIYPKRDGGASAIYFDNGVVYHTNWNAAPASSQAAN
ncbi:MAG TPA: hypothetical protein VIL97_01275 [Thermoanaerobaculia bacterium]